MAEKVDLINQENDSVAIHHKAMPLPDAPAQAVEDIRSNDQKLFETAQKS
jgi:hypothetical protein